jgi:branched-subunit amino acid aminotransferase/4-amino-4-deoxychorismate lyase
MHSTVVMDERVTTLEAVRLDSFLAGFAFGCGLFESVRIERGRPRFLGRHLRRLRKSLDALRDVVEACPGEFLELERVASSVELGLRGCAPDGAEFDGAMKLFVSGGHLLVTFRDLAADHASRLGGVAVDEIDDRTYRHADPLRNHKTLSYLANYRALKRGLLFCNERQQICEAPGANLVAVVNGELVTPPLDAPCLPGIVREVIVEATQIGGLPVRERALHVGELASVEASVLTNAVAIALPVTRLLGRPLEAGSRQLAQRILELVHDAPDLEAGG